MWAWHIGFPRLCGCGTLTRIKGRGSWDLLKMRRRCGGGGGGVLKIKVYLTLTKVFRDNGKLLN